MTVGTLYIVATPIGNLEDMTMRAREVLRTVDIVAAEDTRNTGRLLAHIDAHPELVSYHDHSERTKAGQVLERIKEGKNVALVSDGGTPLISDPGYRLVHGAIEAGIPLVPIPGPTAAITALMVSGLAVDRFTFEGFFSHSPSKRRKELRGLVNEERTMIFYESPHRLLKTLDDIETILGNRRIAVVRELTKKFEEHVRGTVTEVKKHFMAHEVRGEFVIVVEGKKI